LSKLATKPFTTCFRRGNAGADTLLDQFALKLGVMRSTA